MECLSWASINLTLEGRRDTIAMSATLARNAIGAFVASTGPGQDQSLETAAQITQQTRQQVRETIERNLAD